jgi:hypothetical protein
MLKYVTPIRALFHYQNTIPAHSQHPTYEHSGITLKGDSTVFNRLFPKFSACDRIQPPGIFLKMTSPAIYACLKGVRRGTLKNDPAVIHDNRLPKSPFIAAACWFCNETAGIMANHAGYGCMGRSMYGNTIVCNRCGNGMTVGTTTKR